MSWPTTPRVAPPTASLAADTDLASAHLAGTDLVGTALLGTARRAFAGGETGLLDLAALRRTRVVPVRSALPDVEPCPDAELRLAPAAAQELLLAELIRPSAVRIDALLEHFLTHRVGVDPSAWTALARLAARSRRLDRPRLGAALGAQGRWFLRQNPEWRRLAEEAALPVEPQPVADIVSVLDRLAAESALQPLRPGHIAEVALTLPPRSYLELRAATRNALADNPRLRTLVAMVEETLWWRCQVERLFDPSWTLRRVVVAEEFGRSG